MSNGKRASSQNVRVVCRIRPTNQKELQAGGISCVKNNDSSIEVTTEDSSNTFAFDKIFGPESIQLDVFNYTAVPLIQDVLQGYNATIFAYGQTGTGKTHTMEGEIADQELKGIIPRCVEALFNAILEADENIEFTFKVSYVEIYMEKIRDLLDNSHTKVNLNVREDKLKGIYIGDVTEVYVTSHDELLGIMSAGATNRATAATGMNEGSSRSHSVFTITVAQRNLSNSTVTTGKLVLVDLAGSETVRKSNATGQQLEEAKLINKSLSSLGNVINALTEKSSHVPYRDSKLTRILQDSLGGNAKTVLVVAVSPSSFNASETVSTLRFGTRAKSIENKVTVNKTRSVEELEGLLRKAENAIDVQISHIKTLEAQLSAVNVSTGNVDGSIGVGIDGLSVEENMTLEKAVAELRATRAKLEESTLLQKSLQENVVVLSTELEEEKAESQRKDFEVVEVTRILREKEELLGEAGGLLMEAQKQYLAQKDRCESLVREQLDSVSGIDSVRSQFASEIDKLNYDKRESELASETLRTENAQLKKEIDELSGDNKPHILNHIDTSTADNNGTMSGKLEGEQAVSVPGTSTDSEMNLSLNPSESAESITSSTATATATATATVPVPINSRLSVGSYLSKPMSKISDSEFQSRITELSSRLNLPEDAVNEMTALMDQFTNTLAAQQTARDKQLLRDQQKKLQELGTQRQRLEKDLSEQLEKHNLLQYDFDSMSGMEDSQRKEYFTTREKAKSRSLQQRLEQLVVVHRQLLRKFSTMELENVEYRKKLGLRDERIRQVEDSTRGLMTAMRQQTSRHAAELTYLREQVEMLRADHQLRLTETKELALNSSFSVPSSSLHNSQIRTLRGGQQAGAPSTTGTEGGNAAWIQNVIRGKGKGTTAPSATTPTASRQNSLFVDTLGLRINNINIKGENSNNDDSPGPHAASTAAEPDTPNSTGSATSTARALLSRFLGN